MVGNNDSGVNLGAKDENERTPLHWVGAAGRLDVDEFLLGRRQHPRTRVRCFWTTGANTRGAWQESLSTAVELWGKLAYAQHYLAVPLTRSHSLASLVCCVPVALSKLGLCERYQAQPSSEEAGVPSDFFTCDGWTHQTLEPLPSLRVSVTAIHSPMDLKAACKIIAEEAMAVLATSPVDLASGSSLRKRKQ
ncbi:hypothetical protein PR002_g14664 [Phytophthora rubi]|uniref:Uncharacterized protein n=1 Tax=Phytophthora rubi TaxID=129364 RepID=A0A6A3L034_9STRA|nr:hypothetical protein PR002_g14664 [Phytophthora rubi]